MGTFKEDLKTLASDDRALNVMARAISRHRQSLGFTIAEVASHAGMEATDWATIENAKRLNRNWNRWEDVKFRPANPRLDIIARIAKVLGVEVVTLFDPKPPDRLSYLGKVALASRRPAYEIVAEKTREFRSARGISQEVAAKSAHMGLRTWQRIEKGQRGTYLAHVCDVAYALGVDVHTLLGGE